MDEDIATKLEYATGERRAVRVPLSRIEIAMIVAFFVTLVLSLIVIMIGSFEEPYFGTIKANQAIMQVGVASALLLTWIEWAIAMLLLLLTGKIRRLLLLMLVVGTVCVFYLAECPIGYLHDVTRFQCGVP